jgi:hypothetical protein
VSPSTARLRNESGQTIVLLAVALVVLLGCAAIVLDVGYAYYVKRSLQASADAAALAGAQALPSSGDAVALAEQYSGKPGGKNAGGNVPPVSTTATATCRPGSPCNPVNAVEVAQTTNVPTKFATLLGFDSFSVSARAVAQIRDGTVPWAIFSYDSSCDGFGFKYNGNDFNVEGGIRSNGEFEVNGENITAGFASTGGPNLCEPTVDGEGIDFGGGPEPVPDDRLHDWPVYFTPSQFPCTYTGEEFKFNTTGETIPSGVYCASKLFEANGNNQTGNITVLAPDIRVDGDNQRFTPYKHDLLFFATGTNEMILNGNNYDWEGIIFHPNGRIKINGDADSVLTGLIEGLEVEVNGNGFNMVGTGPATGGFAISLVE